MRVIAYGLLVLLCATGYAACFVAYLGSGLRARTAGMAGMAASIAAGGVLPAALGLAATLSPFDSICLVMVLSAPVNLVGFVGWKRRLPGRGRALSAFWERVGDDYLWRLLRRRGAPGCSAAGCGPQVEGRPAAACDMAAREPASGSERGRQE